MGLVVVRDQGFVQTFWGRTWDGRDDRAARWLEARDVVDALVEELELLAVEVLVGQRHRDPVPTTIDDVELHHFVVPDVPRGVRTDRTHGGPYHRHAPTRIDGTALLDAASSGLEWSRIRVRAVAVPNDDEQFALANASEVRPFERGGQRVVAGPLDLPGFGLHAPLDVDLYDDWGTTTLKLERAWSSWCEAGPDRDRYDRIVARLTRLGLELEPPRSYRPPPAPLSPAAPLPPPALAPATADRPVAAQDTSQALLPKPEYVFTASVRPGACVHCRHANQGTVDFAEGHLFCGWAHEVRALESTCDVVIRLPRSRGASQEEWAPYFAFERFDGTNRVVDGPRNATVRAEDAEPATGG
jgi:hypothetical protein